MQSRICLRMPKPPQQLVSTQPSAPCGLPAVSSATGLPLAVMVMSSPACTRSSSPAVLLRSSRDATSAGMLRGSACAGRGVTVMRLGYHVIYRHEAAG